MGLPFTIVVLAMLFAILPAAGIAEASAGRNFTMRLYAAFLEPGLGGRPAVPGDEIALGPLEWGSATSGRAGFSIWRQGGAVEFTTAPDRRRLETVRTDADAQPEGKAMQVWRYRHAYRVEGGRAFWLTLEDHPVPMESGLAQGYDRFLAAVRRLWCARALKARLTSPLSLSPSPSGRGEGEGSAEISDPGLLEKPFFMTYDKGGLIGRPGGEFHIRVWHQPVRVLFRIKRVKPRQEGDWIIGLDGGFTIEFDRAEWRRRHGYRGGPGGYAWDPDFPDPGLPSAVWGPRLDELMERGIDYWADASLTIVLQGLNNQLEKAIAEMPVPDAASRSAPPPALEALRTAARSRRLPD